MAGPLDPLVSTTIAYYAKSAWDALKQNFIVWPLLKQQGNLKYDCSGDPLIGPVEAGRYRPIVSAPGLDISDQVVTRVRHIRYNFPWAELLNATFLDRGLLRRNQGDAGLVDLSKTEIPALVRDLLIGPGVASTSNPLGSLAWHILNTNYALYTGGGLPIYGFPSFLLQPSATGVQGFNPDTNVVSGAPVAAADREAIPTATSQTYGGLTMALSGLGVENVEPDAWTPTLVNLGSSLWTGTQQDYANAMYKALNWTVERACRFDASEATYRGDFGLMDLAHYRFLGDALAAKQTIYMQPSNDQAIMDPNMGYTNANRLRHANTWFYFEKNMPVNSTFLLNANQMELCFQKLYSDQFNSSPLGTATGEDAGVVEMNVNFDPIKRGYIVSGTIPVQMKCSPRYFARLGHYF